MCVYHISKYIKAGHRILHNASVVGLVVVTAVLSFFLDLAFLMRVVLVNLKLTAVMGNTVGFIKFSEVIV